MEINGKQLLSNCKGLLAKFLYHISQGKYNVVEDQIIRNVDNEVLRSNFIGGETF